MAWLSGWAKRKKVTITGTIAGDQTDYQLRLDVIYDGDMQADFDDLRFTLSDGVTLISHWLESKTDGVSAVVWVKVPSIPANPDTVDVYMYYGNPSASSASSGADVFIQYHGAANATFCDSPVKSQPFVYEARVKRNTDGSNNVSWGVGLVDLSDSLSFLTSSILNKVYLRAYNESVSTAVSQAPQLAYNTWYSIKIIQPSMSSGTLQMDTYPDLNVGTNLPDEAMGMFMIIVTGAAEQKWSFIRKYAAVEPTYAFGAETTLTERIALNSKIDQQIVLDSKINQQIALGSAIELEET